MDSKQKIALITGATNGIGKVTALEIARSGATTVIIGRSAARTEATVQEIKAAAGHDRVEAIIADLSSMAEVQRAAQTFRARHDRLHILVNNAGAIFDKRQETADGLEMTFGLNHMSYFLLTHLLLDVLRASAPARIISVSSDAHRMGVYDFDDMQSKHSYGLNGFKPYGQSKLANVLFTYELARRLEGSGVTANALHPGGVGTGFGANTSGLMRLVMRLFFLFSLTPEQGAQTSIHLALSPEVEGVTGKYFDKSKAVQSSPASYDTTAQRRLWEMSEQIARAYLPQTAVAGR